MVIIVNLLLMIPAISETFGLYMLGMWTNDKEAQQSEFAWYGSLIIGSTLLFGFSNLIRMLVVQAYQMNISRVLHESMISKIIRAPINLFFDVTPIGKILNRFSKDLVTLDKEIGR